MTQLNGVTKSVYHGSSSVIFWKPPDTMAIDCMPRHINLAIVSLAILWASGEGPEDECGEKVGFPMRLYRWHLSFTRMARWQLSPQICTRCKDSHNALSNSGEYPVHFHSMKVKWRIKHVAWWTLTDEVTASMNRPHLAVSWFPF